jgi:hypothetical protein
MTWLQRRSRKRNQRRPPIVSDGSSDGGWLTKLFSVALQHGGGGALDVDARRMLRAEESDRSGQAKPAAARTACSTTKS